VGGSIVIIQEWAVRGVGACRPKQRGRKGGKKDSQQTRGEEEGKFMSHPETDLLGGAGQRGLRADRKSGK